MDDETPIYGVHRMADQVDRSESTVGRLLRLPGAPDTAPGSMSNHGGGNGRARKCTRKVLLELLAEQERRTSEARRQAARCRWSKPSITDVSSGNA